MKDITVVFDLDGTMIDTAPDLIAAANFTLERFGYEPVATPIIQPAVGHGAKAMMQAAARALGIEPGESQLNEMIGVFIDYYRVNIAVHSRPFPGFIETLAVLAEAEARLAVCTNKRHELAVKLLADLQLGHRFAAIAGADTFPFRKPDGRHLLGTIQQAGGDPARAVMIGDSYADAGAARDAGVPFIAVSFGYGEKPVSVLEPDAVIDSFHALVPALQTLLSSPKS